MTELDLALSQALSFFKKKAENRPTLVLSWTLKVPQQENVVHAFKQHH